MLTRKIWFLISFMFSFAANAESPWPSVQSNMYPYINGMVLTRHEQTILLGEGDHPMQPTTAAQPPPPRSSTMPRLRLLCSRPLLAMTI